MDYEEVKHKVRKLKKLELKIRFGNIGFQDNLRGIPGRKQSLGLVWDEFFDLHDGSAAKAKYTIKDIAAMGKEEFKNVVSEYFFNVYYKFYKENGITDMPLYSQDMLSQMGLPFDADSNDIKKRFRELAKKFHPDTGGDGDKFIELMENYEKLMNGK